MSTRERVTIAVVLAVSTALGALLLRVAIDEACAPYCPSYEAGFHNPNCPR